MLLYFLDLVNKQIGMGNERNEIGMGNENNENVYFVIFQLLLL